MDDKELRKRLFRVYKQVLIDGKSDDDIETLSAMAKEYLALKKYFDSPKVFDFYGFTEEYIRHATDTNSGRIALLVKELQSVYRKLEDYGLRVVKRPWRKEFHTIKLFTTFFKHDIASKLPSAVEILLLYGYKKVPNNMVKMDSSEPKTIKVVCFELFLSRIELEVMLEVCDGIEEYTSNFTLSDVFMARRKTLGDASKTVESFLKENSIKKVKRMKTDDEEAMKKSREKFENIYKFPAEYEDTHESDFYNGRMASPRTTRDTKYPPSSASYNNLPSSSHQGLAAVTNTAKVRHVSSSVPIDNISDSELYGHSDASSSSGHKENNIPMDTQEDQPRNEAYDATLYVDMTLNDNYEKMYSPDTGESLSTLPPPYGMPPPTYHQAAQIPGNDYVIVKYSDALSNTISALNIGENGYSRVVGVRGQHRGTDIGALKDRIGLTTSSYANPIDYQMDRQATGATAREGKGMGVVSSSSFSDYKTPATSFSTGFGKKQHGKSASYETPEGSSKKDIQRFTSSLDSRERITKSKAQEQYKDRLTRSGPEELTSKRMGDLNSPTATMTMDEQHGKDPMRNGTDVLAAKRSDSTKTNEQHIEDRLARSGSDVLAAKRISDPTKTKEQHIKDHLARSGPDPLTTGTIDPTVTLPYLTSSYPTAASTSAVYSYPKQTHEMVTRSQAKAAEASKPDYLGESFQSTSKTPERHTKETELCIVCSSKATHYCLECKKRACKVCSTTLTRLPCDPYKEHVLVEVPTASSEKPDVGFKDVCSFCGVSTAARNCIFCNKTSCATCSTVYKKDPCVMDSDKTHYFMSQQQQKTSDEHTASQKETTPSSSKGKKPNPTPRVNGENHCDLCALAADLICKGCLKTICAKCIYVYTQDLCPLTKGEHQFENINEQSSNTNETTEASSWSCERCTFLNSASNRICAVCATSRGVNRVDMPKSGSKKCQNCTFANEEGATICRMCSRTFGLDNTESYI